MEASTKTCIRCKLTLPRTEFFHHARYADGLDARCKQCKGEHITPFPYDSYVKVYGITKTEQYMVDKLAEKPTLSAALDNLYRRDHKRWHRIVVAAMLKRREATV